MDIKLKDNPELKVNITQLEYIESTGTQWIDTGIKANNNNQTFKIGISFLSNNQHVGSGETNSSSASAYIFRNSSNALAVNWGNWSSEGSVLQSNYPLETLAEIEIKAGSLIKLNGNNTSKTAQNVSFSSGRTANFILNGNSNASNNSIQCSTVRTHYFIVENSGVEIIHLIPVKKDISGVVCLYDTVSKTFFYNQGTGNFVAGPKVPSTIIGLPDEISMRITTFYHKNILNVDGLLLLNSILDCQKTHQDEVKDIYYPTTPLWQNIVTTYPAIVPYYNQNHHLAAVVCEASNPSQSASDFINIVEQYPDVNSVFNSKPALIPILAEWNPLIHNLVETDKNNFIETSGTQIIETNIVASNGFKVLVKLKTKTDTSSYQCIVGRQNEQSPYGRNFVYIKSGNSLLIESKSWGKTGGTLTNNTFYTIESSTELTGSTKINDQTITLSQTDTYRDASYTNLPLQCLGRKRSGGITDGLSAKINSLVISLSDIVVINLVPFYHNNVYCMIDLVNLDIYNNVGTGEFTYTLEPKNA